MTVAYLLDTDVVIDVLRGRASPTLRRRMTEEAGRLAITTVTLSELVYGAERSADPARNRRAIREFTPFVVVLDLDADSAEHAGEIRASLATTGTPIGGYDLLIAGVARSRGLAVVTRNQREFRRVDGLMVQDWSAPETA